MLQICLLAYFLELGHEVVIPLLSTFPIFGQAFATMFSEDFDKSFSFYTCPDRPKIYSSSIPNSCEI